MDYEVQSPPEGRTLFEGRTYVLRDYEVQSPPEGRTFFEEMAFWGKVRTFFKERAFWGEGGCFTTS